ncbi:MAG: hypothetical protein A3E87_10040 [Gammaproteobacteria bacterium RIFCSPHIGHO2_12_FULL_35_23]|nr:MAG: hypothetical protein A3E87_10040 [Gammaproteobacteria bacterium RIFCSPHIGHO2_12_FULL_35_23]
MSNLAQNLEALLAKGQDNALLRFGLGNVYFEAENYNKAEEYLNKALAFDMHYTAAWKLYAKTLVKLGKSQEAKAAFEKGIVIAEQKGDKQAAKEMQVFLKRLQKQA